MYNVCSLLLFYCHAQERNGEGMNGREMTEEDERRMKFQAEVSNHHLNVFFYFCNNCYMYEENREKIY